MKKHREHIYSLDVRWTGNLGAGTSGYASYSRDHEISGAGKKTIFGSADPAFRGDPCRYNPEELLLSSLSTCHMLWYLHLCADAGIVISEYVDRPSGTMIESPSGTGQFSKVLLRPMVRIAAGGDAKLAKALHDRAHEMCFISRSVNFPVDCEVAIQVESH